MSLEWKYCPGRCGNMIDDEFCSFCGAGYHDLDESPASVLVKKPRIKKLPNSNLEKGLRNRRISRRMDWIQARLRYCENSKIVQALSKQWLWRMTHPLQNH